ncbi:MAG: hypothetical protein IJY27_02455 [Clostridia bacterium]|nr:hypothetical protein [Clostridia bacterium]
MKKITKILVLILAVVVIAGALPVYAAETSLNDDIDVVYEELLEFRPFGYRIDILHTTSEKTVSPLALPESQTTQTFEYKLGRNGVHVATATVVVTYLWSRANSYSEISDIDVTYSGTYKDEFGYDIQWETDREWLAKQPDTYEDLKFDEVEVWLLDLKDSDNPGYVVINYAIYDNGTFVETPMY